MEITSVQPHPLSHELAGVTLAVSYVASALGVATVSIVQPTPITLSQPQCEVSR